METLKIIVFLVCYTIAAICASCPDGWLRHQSTCYHLSHDMEDWPGAKTICAVLGGSLAEVDDATEATFIAGQAKSLKKDFWLSLTDLAEEGIWQWMGSMTPLSPSVALWASGQPDNWGRGGENCAFVHGTDGHWIDAPCSSQRNYICEKDDGESLVVG